MARNDFIFNVFLRRKIIMGNWNYAEQEPWKFKLWLCSSAMPWLHYTAFLGISCVTSVRLSCNHNRWTFIYHLRIAHITSQFNSCVCANPFSPPQKKYIVKCRYYKQTWIMLSLVYLPLFLSFNYSSNLRKDCKNWMKFKY